VADETDAKNKINTSLQKNGISSIIVPFIGILCSAVLIVIAVGARRWILAQISVIAVMGFVFWLATRLANADGDSVLNRSIKTGHVDGSSETNKQRESERQAPKFLLRLVGLAGVGIVGVVLFAIQYTHWEQGQVAAIASVGFLAAGAAWLVGALLGFLFGIPYSDRKNGDTSSSSESDKSPTQSAGYRANTNLEQISDWLTKILVGVTLVEINKVPIKLDKLASYLASGMGGCPGAKPFSLVIVVFFSVCGFFFGFLWARLFLPEEYRLADVAALDKKIDELKKQREIDVAALTLARRHLDPPQGDPGVDLEELKAAIVGASAAIKANIFGLARQVRTANENDDPAKVAATIPVFEALIESDTRREFHRNHAQLAYILAKQGRPALERAKSEIESAMAIRDRLKLKGWENYELTRASINIKQDEAFAQGQPSNSETRGRIVEDLQVVVKSRRKRDMEEDVEVMRWIELNKAQTDLG